MIMKLSEGVEWGLHCATVLAALPSGATLPAKALAEFHGVSETYLVKHLKELVKAGVLESVPGPKGGYRLARPAEQTTLLDIVEAIEGRESAYRCTEIRRRGPAALDDSAYRLPCAINLTMLLAEKAWRDVLHGRTLADLVETVASQIDPRAASKALPWLQQHLRR